MLEPVRVGIYKVDFKWNSDTQAGIAIRAAHDYEQLAGGREEQGYDVGSRPGRFTLGAFAQRFFANYPRQ
jgi:hypothetical protein